MRHSGFGQAIFVFAIGFALSGCGTVLGMNQSLQVGSNPTGARVVTNPVTQSHTTPATLTLERKNSYTITLSKPGYSNHDIALEKRIRAGVLVADILLFPVGLIVDAITGAWYEHSPSPVNIQMNKATAEADGPDIIYVTLRAGQGDKEIIVESSAPVSVGVNEKGPPARAPQPQR